MTKRLVDIDDDLLAQARAALARTTLKDTVNRAFAEAVRLERARHVRRMSSCA